jgi:hypothetical protein
MRTNRETMKRGWSIAIGVLIALSAVMPVLAHGKDPIVRRGTLESIFPNCPELW